MNPLIDLHKNAGQSIWLDFITRSFMAEGKLQKLISEDGLRGVTSNPTIFQKALGGSEYDEQINQLVRTEKSTDEIFEELAIADIQRACDLFKPVYDQAQGRDGFVSIEVDPRLASDTQGTLTAARRLWSRVNRPNVMVKIPATQQGLPAIEQSLSEGININITLIFSLERYDQVMEAWLKGLERLAATGKKLDRVASVASFFVSRVDSIIDKTLQEKGNTELQGKAAIANARTAYQMFLKVAFGARYKALMAKGAQLQRPLWASTSTKNPKYCDVLYVEELIGPDTVNTLPPATIDAFRDHGKVRNSLVENPQNNAKVLADLAAAGIDMKQVTQHLEDDGVKLFAESYGSMIKSLDEKRQAMKVAR
jgi:transaldolase